MDDYTVFFSCFKTFLGFMKKIMKREQVLSLQLFSSKQPFFRWKKIFSILFLEQKQKFLLFFLAHHAIYLYCCHNQQYFPSSYIIFLPIYQIVFLFFFYCLCLFIHSLFYLVQYDGLFQFWENILLRNRFACCWVDQKGILCVVYVLIQVSCRLFLLVDLHSMSSSYKLGSLGTCLLYNLHTKLCILVRIPRIIPGFLLWLYRVQFGGATYFLVEGKMLPVWERHTGKIFTVFNKCILFFKIVWRFNW